MSPHPKVIAWDFDGVLNNNIEDGSFVWSRSFDADLGLPHAAFQRFMFPERFHRALHGVGDLRTFVAEWLQAFATPHTADDILKYWFSRDARPDPDMMARVEQMSARGAINIIATNNEIYRAHFIEHDMGFGAHVDHIFAAGRMKTAKPSAAFFRLIETALQLPPEAFFLIDDSLDNVNAARKCGWAAFHFQPQNYRALDQFLGV